MPGYSGNRHFDNRRVTAFPAIDIVGRHDDVPGPAGKILQDHLLRGGVSDIDTMGVVTRRTPVIDTETVDIRQRQRCSIGACNGGDPGQGQTARGAGG
jgi:hypothetical protein